MRKLLLLMVLVISGACLADSEQSVALLPLPRTLVLTDQSIVIGNNWRIYWKGARTPLLERAAARFIERLRQRTGIAITENDKRLAQTLVIDCAAMDANALSLNSGEQYSLVVERGRIVLRAPTSTGVLRGLMTLVQLVVDGPEGFRFAGARIDDAPRYAWRGLMIDAARHFIPVDVLKRQLDAMELVKLNVLHLHLSDNEGFRVESKTFPKFQQASNEFYPQAQIRELIAYAADRGIRIVPEFDVPGHARSWLRAYPALASNTAALNSPLPFGSDTLDPSREETYQFVAKLFGEMNRLFPDSYFHIGGDEVNGADWGASPRIRQFMRDKGFADNRDLQRYFTKRVHALLAKNHKVMIGWDEVLGFELPKDVMIESWRSAKMTARAAQAGYATLSAGGAYLDRNEPAEVMYQRDPADPLGYGLTPAEWREIEQTPLVNFFSKDTVVDASIQLTGAERARIRGGEAAMWTEIVTAEMIDGRVWPRAAAIAERLWSADTATNIYGLYRRLFVIDRQLELFGLQHYQNRSRMVARLAPEDVSAVTRFIDVVEPVRNLAHWQLLRSGFRATGQQFNQLADAAFPESLSARRFELDVEAFLLNPTADNPVRSRIRLNLQSWRDNDRAFRAAALRAPMLREALPISADLAALATAGLTAIELIETHKSADEKWVQAQRELLQKQERWQAASATPIAAMTEPQPPADLLIAVAPGVRLLVERATKPVGEQP